LAPCCIAGFGVGVTVKLFAVVAEPAAFVTVITPVVAPGMTYPTSFVAELEIIRADLPPIITDCAFSRLVPFIVTRVPAGPFTGLKEVIVKGGVTVNSALPQVVVTRTF
jgi:hypothetical protein